MDEATKRIEAHREEMRNFVAMIQAGTHRPKQTGAKRKAVDELPATPRTRAGQCRRWLSGREHYFHPPPVSLTTCSFSISESAAADSPAKRRNAGGDESPMDVSCGGVEDATLPASPQPNAARYPPLTAFLLLQHSRAMWPRTAPSVSFAPSFSRPTNVSSSRSVRYSIAIDRLTSPR